MRWLGRGRLNVTQERKRSMRVNLWLWQLPPADASPPPPLHPATPGPAYTRQEPGQMKAVSLSLSVKKMWQVLTSDDSVMYRHQKADVFIMRSQRGLGWVKQYAHTSLLPPHELNPFILSWINPSCYLALRHGIICHKVYFCVNFCTCAKTFFGKIEVLTVNNFDVISGLNSWQMIFFPWIICSVRKLALSLLLIMQEINNTLYWSNNF